MKKLNCSTRVLVRFSGILFVSFFSLVAGISSAAGVYEVEKSPVIVHLDEFKVIHESNGKDQYTNASAVKPGDVIEYRAKYTNQSSKTVKGLRAIIPIPAGLEFVPKSTKPESIQPLAATSNGQYASIPLVHQVSKDGAVVQSTVPYAEYRFVRWGLGELKAGTSKEVSLRAHVISTNDKDHPENK